MIETLYPRHASGPTPKVERLIPESWSRCCRCYPSAVGVDGFCGCCLFNHRTGERLERPSFDDIYGKRAVPLVDAEVDE